MTYRFMPHDKEKIAQLVKTGRQTKGYTQTELSELTRISLRSIQRIENAEVLPRLYTLKVLAGQLGFQLDDAAIEVSADLIPLKTNGRTRKFILSVGAGLLILLLAFAFLLQSAHFPETTFEAVLYWAAVLAIYLVALLRIWK